MSQHINIEDYLEPTDPPLPLPQISTFDGNNTINSTVTLGETMITQGYRIPLKIKQGATTKTADIYIGSSPLTQGQSITKAQSGQDITLFSGDNIIDTTLVNKPQVDLTYRSSVLGVGERTENVCTAPTAQTKTNGALSVTTDGQGRYNISISSTTSTQTEVSFDLPEFTMPISVGQGGYGTFSMFNTIKSNIYITFYYNDTQIEYWFLSEANRQTNSYISMGNKKCNKIVFRTAGTVYAGTAECAIMFTNDSILPTEYVPYGYQIPISVTSGQTTTPYNYYIGNAPLAAGQSISKTSTSTDIALLSGTNAISTTLGNKPEMKIDYLSTEVGVGERTKNIINYTDIDATEYGVHGYWENDSVHVEGVFSESTPKAPQSFRRYCYLEAGTYILSGSTDYATTGFHLQIGTCSDDTGSNFNIIGYDNGSGYTLTLQDASYVGVHIHIAAAASGQQIDAIMPIMLRKATTTSDFIPYGYQIPIQIIQRTENLFSKDVPYTASKYLNASGEEISGSTWGISEYIPIEGNTIYTAYNLSGKAAAACWYDENKTCIGGEAYNGAASKSFSLPSNAKYIRITIQLLNPSNIDTLMLIKGRTSPENYIPYYNIIEKDIYIGDSLLIEGQSVTKELLLEDIPTYNGETIIDTTLYNKPYSIIIPTNKAANIIKEIQKLWDAVKSINPSSQSNSIDILKKRIKLSNNVDSPVIIANITDVKVYEEDTQNSSNQESGDLI